MNFIQLGAQKCPHFIAHCLRADRMSEWTAQTLLQKQKAAA